MLEKRKRGNNMNEDEILSQEIELKQEDSIQLRINDEIIVTVFNSNEGYVIDVYDTKEDSANVINSMTIWEEEYKETDEAKRDRIEEEIKNISSIFISSYGDIHDLHRAYKDDKTSVRYTFSTLIDGLNKDGDVSDDVVQNVDLGYDKEYNLFTIDCLDIRYNIDDCIFV
jgi:hypothetical protein